MVGRWAYRRGESMAMVFRSRRIGWNPHGAERIPRGWGGSGMGPGSRNGGITRFCSSHAATGQDRKGRVASIPIESTIDNHRMEWIPKRQGPNRDMRNEARQAATGKMAESRQSSEYGKPQGRPTAPEPLRTRHITQQRARYGKDTVGMRAGQGQGERVGLAEPRGFGHHTPTTGQGWKGRWPPCLRDHEGKYTVWKGYREAGPDQRRAGEAGMAGLRRSWKMANRRNVRLSPQWLRK